MPAVEQSQYIVRSSNDFAYTAIRQYTSELVSQGLSEHTVTFAGFGANGPQAFSSVVSEVRAGRSVMLQVPNGHGGTHRVLAYGLADPTKTDFSDQNHADILVFDPGHGNINTLADYDNLIGDATWLNDASKAKLFFFVSDRPSSPLLFSLYSPASMVLTDPQGHRLGFDPVTGAFHEIADGQYEEEQPWTLLDEDTPTERTESIKHLFVDHPLPGSYELTIIGTGDGHYDISVDGTGLVGLDRSLLSGEISLGQRITLHFQAVPEPSTWALGFTAACLLTLVIHGPRCRSNT